MSINKWEEIQDKLQQWHSIETEPPFTEVEALRMLDAAKRQDRALSTVNEVFIYSIIIYYRMKRNKSDSIIKRIYLMYHYNYYLLEAF